MSNRSIKADGKRAGGSPAATRERILGSAEQVFAERGYEGASVRRIALGADVPIALVNYHFGNKEGLYRSIFELRTPTIVDQRIAGLELAATETDLDRRLELTIKALIIPMLRLRGTERHSWFVRILSREVTDPNANTRGIVAQFFDPVAKRFLDELKACLPHAAETDLHWGYHAMLGVMVYIVGDTGRIVRLSDGACDPDNHEDAAAHVVSLLLAALKHGGLDTRPPQGQALSS